MSCEKCTCGTCENNCGIVLSTGPLSDFACYNCEDCTGYDSKNKRWNKKIECETYKIASKVLENRRRTLEQKSSVLRLDDYRKK